MFSVNLSKYTLLAFSVIALFQQGCKQRRTIGGSTTKHIIVGDNRGGERKDGRFTVENPSDFPFIMASETGCTVFIIDAEQNIAMSGSHCKYTKEERMSEVVLPRLCYGAKQNFKTVGSTGADPIRDAFYSDPVRCPFTAKITKLLDYSPPNIGNNEGADFVIFQYEWTGIVPTAERAVKLSNSRDDLTVLRQGNVPIQLVGYPADRNQNRKLTKSECSVVADWTQTAKLREQQALLKMSQTTQPGAQCYKYFKEFFGDYVHYSGGIQTAVKPMFGTNCSVYGGNSGGPYLVNWQGEWVVLGMPDSFLDSASMKNFRENFDPVRSECKEVYDKNFLTTLGAGPWKELDAFFASDPGSMPDSENLRFLPKGLPMADQVQKSQWLQKFGKKYLKSLVPGLEEVLDEQTRQAEIERALREIQKEQK